MFASRVTAASTASSFARHLIVSRRRTRYFSTGTTWDYDVLILGGGIVGASLACRLAETLARSRGLKIGLLESRPPPPLDSCLAPDRLPDPRVYALAPSSVAFLKSVGAWQFIGDRWQEYQYMQVWEGGASGSIRFDASQSTVMGVGSTGTSISHGDEKNKKKLGTMAENSTVQAALFQRMEALQAEGLLELYCPAHVQSMAFDNAGSDPAGPARITWLNQDGEKKEVTTRLLVGADGAASRVKKVRGLPSWGWDYGQRALVATVSLEDASSAAAATAPAALEASPSSPDDTKTFRPPSTAWQIFLPEGPLALLPLWGSYHSIVWSTTPAEADRLQALSKEDFLAELNLNLQHPVGLLDPPSLPSFLPSPLSRAIGGVHHLLESVVVSAALNQGFHLPPHVHKLCGPRLSFDLRAEHATAYVGPRAVLVGDAAHTIHPMAGQGLNLGIADVVALAELLESGVEEGQDLGNVGFLKGYERERQVANLGMLGGLTALHQLYGRREGGWKWMRNVGLGALNGLGPVKAKIAAVAMGK
ncbi:ubiquinone biosynthesis monooxygenase coq6 [Nannochloropsis oceanica]